MCKFHHKLRWNFTQVCSWLIWTEYFTFAINVNTCVEFEYYIWNAVFQDIPSIYKIMNWEHCGIWWECDASNLCPSNYAFNCVDHTSDFARDVVEYFTCVLTGNMHARAISSWLWQSDAMHDTVLTHSHVKATISPKLTPDKRMKLISKKKVVGH